MKDSVDFTVFTPGSSAGESSTSFLRLRLRRCHGRKIRKLLREKIASIITALLGTSGVEGYRSTSLPGAYPSFQSSGGSLEPWAGIGYAHADHSDPKTTFRSPWRISRWIRSSRKRIAWNWQCCLNSFLASPSFETWQEGTPLDIQQLLYTKDGKPRHSIFYMAHLDDNERMFFVTLLFTAVESWMFTQRGTGTLRALLYFDEILGYLPPTARPPSHAPIASITETSPCIWRGPSPGDPESG